MNGCEDLSFKNDVNTLDLLKEGKTAGELAQEAGYEYIAKFINSYQTSQERKSPTTPP